LTAKKKVFMKKIMTLAFTLLLSNFTKAQEITEKNQLYIGIGIGLDYGSLGGKIEYLPIEEVSVFGGIGYNYVNVGWNLGGSYNIKMSERVTLKPTAMYGSNGSVRIDGSPKYDKVSNGLTLGLGLDLNAPHSLGKWNFGLYVPIRSKEFMDHYDMLKSNSSITLKNKLIPIGITVGYNFKIN